MLDNILQVVKTNWEDKREFSQIQKGSMSWIFRNSFCQGWEGKFKKITTNGIIEQKIIDLYYKM